MQQPATPNTPRTTHISRAAPAEQVLLREREHILHRRSELRRHRIAPPLLDLLLKRRNLNRRRLYRPVAFKRIAEVLDHKVEDDRRGGEKAEERRLELWRTCIRGRRGACVSACVRVCGGTTSYREK